MAEDSGGGGGSSGTPWHSISIYAMWNWVDRDLSPHYQQATSWKKTSELTGLYQQRLQAYRDRLAQSWNPESSPAAEAYMTKLDELIVAVRNVDEVAGRNYQASVDIPNAISEAKYKLKPIYDRYKAAYSEYSQSQTAPTPRPSGESSPNDRMNDEHAAAVVVMRELGSDLSGARTSLGPPNPYEAPKPKRDTGGDYGATPPPMIPPVMPVPPASSPGPGPMGPTSPMPAPRGPDLTGLNPGPMPSSPGPQPVVTPGPGGGTGPMPPAPPTGVIRPPGGPTPVGPVQGRPNVPPARGPVIGGLGATPPRGPAGGVIGGPPGGGRGPGGLRPNPVGGMIGGPASGAGRAGGPGAAGVVGRGGTGAAGPAGGAGRGPGGPGAAGRGGAGAMGVAGRPGQRGDEDGEHFDPDTAWEVAEGVAPVLDTPDKQGPIDPGPAIGLNK